MITHCQQCGKKINIKPIEVERKQIDPEHINCFNCNHHLHKTVKHPDCSQQQILKHGVIFEKNKETTE